MKSRALILITLVMSCVSTYAQNGFSKLFRYSGDTLQRGDLIADIIFDSVGNNLFFSSYGFYYGGGPPVISSVLYKTDLNGNVLKEVLDTLPTGHNVGYESLALSKDHKYIYWGGAAFVYGNLMQWKIRKTDTNLNVIWDKYYSCNALQANISTIKMLPENESFLALMQGYTNADNGWGYPETPPRIYLKHIDSSGNVLSEDTLGPGYYDNPNDMELSNDGGYLINGRSFSWGQNNGSGYVLKADTAGNELWHQFYAQDAYSTWLDGIVKSREATESYYNTGQVAPLSDYNGIGFINKTDANGDEIWNRKLSVNGISDGFFAVAAAKNNYDIATAGSVYYPNEGYSRGWVVRLDKEGNEKWGKLYTTNPPGNYQEYLYSIAALPDGGFVAAGSSWGQDANGHWTQDGWVIRVDSNGCIDPQDCGLDVGMQHVALNTNSITIYPNPAKDEFKIISDSPFPKGTTIWLSDLYGRTVRQLPAPAQGTREISYPLRGVAPGVYFVQLQNAAITIQKKIVITR